MNNMQRSYRQVKIGDTTPEAVTVGIESDTSGALKAAVWWEAVGDVDADEAEYGDVNAALEAAEAARALHGFKEVVVALQQGVSWNDAWGRIDGVQLPDLSDDEAFALAAGIEAERDA